MQQETIISWHASDANNTVKTEHREALEEGANQRITEMMSEGFTGGELVEHVRTSDADGEDGVLYTGWWSVETKVLQ